MPINSFLYPGAKFIPGYEVANSCRFNQGDSPYMHITRSSADGTAGRKSTISFWFKRVNTADTQYVFHCGSPNYTHIYISSGGSLCMYDSGDNITWSTSAKLRDYSAWYHAVIKIDTTQGSNADRVKFYLNGTTEMAYASYGTVSEDTQLKFGNAVKHTVGRRDDNSSDYFDGYLAEFCFIDGSALAPTEFGEYDEDTPTIWKPKDVSGLTFGTNGFYLDFEDSSALGNDANGGTDLTVSGLAAIDQTTDTPTNNFCTMNPLNVFQYNFTFSEGNLKLANTDNNWNGASGTIAINKGKWFFEAKYTGSSNLQHFYVGFTGIEAQNASDATRNSVAFYNNDGGEVAVSDVSNNASTTADYGTFAQNDIIGVALDYDNELISFYKNGSAIVTDFDFGATTYPSGLTDGKLLSPYVGHYASSDIVLNFGNPPFSISSGNADDNGYGNFEYDVPTGYLALCTKNLGSDGG
tara:strand:- start:723 stop:2120 length:1398 start_codon:yes stop_codon:yes gene_type:complete